MNDKRKLPTTVHPHMSDVLTKTDNSLIKRGLDAVTNIKSQRLSVLSEGDLDHLFQDSFDRNDYETALSIIRELEIRGSMLAQKLVYEFLIAAEPRDVFDDDDDMAQYEADTERESERVEKFLLSAAEWGDALAQDILATFYSGSASRGSKLFEAFKWCCKAAEQGRAGAQLQLGLMYYGGKGIQIDYINAQKWLKKAAEPNSQDADAAQFYLGQMFYKGDGVQQNFTEARNYFHKFVDCGRDVALVVDAQFRLGEMYFRGEGGPIDYVKSYMWLTIILKRSRFDIKATKLIYELSKKMGEEEMAKARKLADEWAAFHAS